MSRGEREKDVVSGGGTRSPWVYVCTIVSLGTRVLQQQRGSLGLGSE